MRIVVSGTHASAKSTLISDFSARHASFAVLPDPFESIDEAWDAPGAAMFAAQLRVAADRLLLREAMNDTLIDLLDDPELIGGDLTVVEIAGDPAARLAALEREVERGA